MYGFEMYISMKFTNVYIHVTTTSLKIWTMSVCLLKISLIFIFSQLIPGKTNSILT